MTRPPSSPRLPGRAPGPTPQHLPHRTPASPHPPAAPTFPSPTLSRNQGGCSQGLMAGRLLPARAPHPGQGHCLQPAGMQSSGCAGAVGPASGPAPPGAAWDGRGDTGAVAGAGGGRKGDVSTELCPERAQVGVLSLPRPCLDAAPPRWAQHPAAPQTEAAPTRRFRGHVGRPCPLTVTPGGCPLGRGAHSQRKRTYQTVSFFSCGPNSGLACARMAISQLRTDGGREARGWGEAGGEGRRPGGPAAGRVLTRGSSTRRW